MHLQVCLCTRTTHASASTHMHHTCTHTHASVHTHTHAHAHIHTHTCLHTHVYIYICTTCISHAHTHTPQDGICRYQPVKYQKLWVNANPVLCCLQLCFSLHGSSLGDDGIQLLGKSLLSHPNIVSLDVGDCQLGDVAVDVLYDLLLPEHSRPGEPLAQQCQKGQNELLCFVVCHWFNFGIIYLVSRKEYGAAALNEINLIFK